MLVAIKIGRSPVRLARDRHRVCRTTVGTRLKHNVSVLCCVVLCCIVWYGTVRYCTVLHCIVLYCTGNRVGYAMWGITVRSIMCAESRPIAFQSFVQCC